MTNFESVNSLTCTFV